jgi:hypothetical protein
MRHVIYSLLSLGLIALHELTVTQKNTNTIKKLHKDEKRLLDS